MPLPLRDAQLVQITDAAFADAAARAGARLACHMGCTQCCHGVFAINALDIERLHAGMAHLRGQDPSIAARLVSRAQVWLERHAAEFPGDPKTGILGQSEEEQERFDAFASEAACPALDPLTGRCDVYAWRPMTCRVFGPPVRLGQGNELGCCELCFVNASPAEVMACEMPVPHEIEAQLLDELAHARGSSPESIVAFALLDRPR